MGRGSKKSVACAPHSPSIVDARCESVDGGSNVKKAYSIRVGTHRWTTAQHPNKTIRDLIAIVQRNAKKLNYFGDKHLFISSLQLASEDDHEREDLDFDLTLGDLSVCMKGKHLVAVTKSNNPPSPAAISTIATADSEVAPIAEATLTRDFPAPKDTNSPAEPHTFQIRSVDTKCSFHGDSDDGNGQSTTPDVEVAIAKFGAMATHCGGSSAILGVTVESTSDPHPMERSIESGEEVPPLIPVKLSDLSPYFHLKLACAAKELGVPKSEFKKLCKNLGLIRWPGCKVRRLQKAIERLGLKIAEGGQTVQVEGFANRLNFLKECYDKLLHGTPAQMNTVVDSRAVLVKEYPRLYAEVVRSGDECQRCHGLINIIQSSKSTATTKECVRLDDKSSATEHSTLAYQGSLPINRRACREARCDDVRVVGMQKAAKDIIMVADEGTRGCTCYVVIRGKKWYPCFEREGPWLQRIANNAMSL